MMTANSALGPELQLVRVELSYCPRCGTLRAESANASREFCPACVRFLEWVRTGGLRLTRGRPRRENKSSGGRP
jgi:hypothetical protein